MTDDFTIVVGTTGSGVFQSDTSGRTWNHSKVDLPYAPWSPWVDTRAVALDPANPRRVWSGSHIGLTCSEDGGRTFRFVTAPFDRKQIWSIAVHPHDSDRIFVGIAPEDTEAPIWRTADGGKTWEEASLNIPPRNPINGAIHVTSFAFHPQNADILYASIEIGGLFRSDNGGDSWTKMTFPDDSPLHGDCHAVIVSNNGTVYATSPLGYYRSVDGESFTFDRFERYPDQDERELGSGMTAYCRFVVALPDDPDTVMIGTGDTTPGKAGNIEISRDNGGSWTKANLPVAPNTHIYHLAVHPAKSDRVVAASHYGYLYVTEDAGRSWSKLPREFSEIRGLAWLPR